MAQQNPTALTLAQIRAQTSELIGRVMSDQDFTTQQMDEAINWACERLATVLGMTYVPLAHAVMPSGDGRMALLPDKAIKVVQAVLDSGQPFPQVTPSPSLATQVFGSIDTLTFGDSVGAMASDGADTVFMARYAGTSANPKGWIIVRASRTAAFSPEIVAGVLGPNTAWPTPPTSDPEYVTPVDGAAGTSLVNDVLTMAVSPDGGTVAWLEGSTNRLRIVRQVAGVWTTYTIAGSSSTYRVDGLGSSAGFSAGLSGASDPAYGNYGPRWATGWGIAFLDTASSLLLVETPLAKAVGGITTPVPSRLLHVDADSGQVTTLATDVYPPVKPISPASPSADLEGSWTRVTVLPASLAVQGCRVLIQRQYLGSPVGTPGFAQQPTDPIQPLGNGYGYAIPAAPLPYRPIGSGYPRLVALEGYPGDPTVAGQATVVLQQTGTLGVVAGTEAIPGYAAGVGVDLSPSGMVLARPINPLDLTWAPTPQGGGSAETAVVFQADGFPGHGTSLPFGSWGVDLGASEYLQPGVASCWCGNELLMVHNRAVYSLGGS